MNTELMNFLLGAGPLDGVWFGEKHPTLVGNFWWRKFLRAACADDDWQPISTLPAHGYVVMFCDAYGNRWTDNSDGPWESNGCGSPPAWWRNLPPAPARKECEEQARLNGAGASREAALMAKLAEARTDIKAAYYELYGVGPESSKEFHRIGIDSAREILSRHLTKEPRK